MCDMGRQPERHCLRVPKLGVDAYASLVVVAHGQRRVFAARVATDRGDLSIAAVELGPLKLREVVLPPPVAARGKVHRYLVTGGGGGRGGRG